MNTQTIYHIALTCHIIGLTMMAGITLANYLLFIQFWKQFSKNKERAAGIQEAISKLSLLFGIGILVLILSGVGMMALTNGVFGEQLWFRIKFGLVILVIVNGLVVGRRQGIKLRKLLAEDAAGKNVLAPLFKIKNNINLFHLSQILLFLIIFSLSVFKFN